MEGNVFILDLDEDRKDQCSIVIGLQGHGLSQHEYIGLRGGILSSNIVCYMSWQEN